MDWVTRNNSRSKIDRAGDILASDDDDLFKYFEAYSIMDNWRASHAFPLNTIQMTLRRRSRQIDKNAIIAQRLKRAPSIITKLTRENSMKLSRMQDIGGCRSIVTDVKDVYALLNRYQRSQDRHEIATLKDYITDPKDSGYRGIHIIYKYKSDRNNAYNNQRIEIQLRTHAQHAWATSVEIAGIFTNAPLKSSIGPKDWLAFFKWASSAFSLTEGTNCLHPDLEPSEILLNFKKIETKLNALEGLERFSNTHRLLSRLTSSKEEYFLLILDSDKNETEVMKFYNMLSANVVYAEKEKKFRDSNLIDVVLVKSENIENLSKAYPNYFVDTKEFIEISRNLCGL